MFKRFWLALGSSSFSLLLAGSALGAGGEKAANLIVVADTRHLSGFSHYIGTLYNENIWLFALWSIVLTTALGVGLGLLMDFIMKRTGIDLGKTRKVEH